MKKLALLAAATSLLALAGCATIVGDTDETITLKSSPSGANISITDEKGSETFTGSTPTTVQLEKADGSYFGGKTYTVEIHKPGFQSRTLTIDSRLNGWYLGGNLLFGGWIGWLVVDPMTGAMYNLSPNEINAELKASVASSDENGKTLNIVMLDDLPKRLHQELELIGNV